ncbi:hypothetical protein FIM08_01140 [SAR202 cluster bacterium AC-647-N09_OGT_505m]|nr:hypothetical protein [SAR202 cluster bacterium AC-647-N09_OGT_505m]
MPKPAPLPDEISKPLWDACNERRLVMQNCKTCNLLQYPPQASCENCGAADNLEWLQMSGRGKIHGYTVMYDCRVRSLQPDQPFNIALVELAEDPAILMYSHLPGVPVDEVPVGADVKVTFEETSTGQLVFEWELAG